jgi:hypothetical protein
MMESVELSLRMTKPVELRHRTMRIVVLNFHKMELVELSYRKMKVLSHNWIEILKMMLEQHMKKPLHLVLLHKIATFHKMFPFLEPLPFHMQILHKMVQLDFVHMKN